MAIMKEECVNFHNYNGLVLKGILHKGSAENYKKLTIICLNTGLNDMVGWHRLQVKVARFLAENGYNVLRFDNFGIGESEGELSEGIIVDLFATIEKGLWLNDAKCATDFIESRTENEKIIYLGYCGGALTAIHAAAQDRRIVGVINVAAPVTLSNVEYLEKKDPWTVKRKVDSYKRKILKPKSVLNFFIGKSDYSEVFKSIIHVIRHKFAGRYNIERTHKKPDVDIKNLNYSLFDSFNKFMKTKKRPILFYYAELDNATWGLKKYFLSKFQDTGKWKKSGCKFIELEYANHIFSDEESQEGLKQDIINWIEEKYLGE